MRYAIFQYGELEEPYVLDLEDSCNPLERGDYCGGCGACMAVQTQGKPSFLTDSIEFATDVVAIGRVIGQGRDKQGQPFLVVLNTQHGLTHLMRHR